MGDQIVRKSGWFSSAINMVGTPCKAVHFSCSTVCSTFRGSKVITGTIVAPGTDTGQGAQHTPEAMKKGNRDTQAVLLRQFHALRHISAVVDDIVVRKHHSFGKSGGAGRVLHVDHIIGMQRCLTALCHFLLLGPRPPSQTGPSSRNIPGFRSSPRKMTFFSLGSLCGAELSGRRFLQFRTDFIEHVHIAGPFNFPPSGSTSPYPIDGADIPVRGSGNWC